MPPPFRHSRIVCTLGPATDERGVLEACLEAGLDVARINAAHGSAEEHARRILRVRRLASSLGRSVAILLDLPGPKLRLGRLEEGGRELRRGSEIVLGRDPGPDGLPVQIPRLSRQVKAGESIYLSDGSVRLRVLGTGSGEVRARVLAGGAVRSGSGLNLPESRLTIRLPTEDDLRWIRFAREQELDWVGVSFVRTSADVEAVRKKLGAARSRVLAKIEKRQALEELDRIVEAADGVMVARGDLGVETPLHEVPVVQKRIIAAANRRGRPVITATQMLESMVEDPAPTRAEVTDVANAVLDGTDAVMLSAETAIGAHPVRAVETLRDVILATEGAYPYGGPLSAVASGETVTLETALAAQAVRLSAELGARALVMPAEALEDVAALARLRPRAPVLALTDSAALFRQLALVWGVAPIRLAPDVELGERIEHARRWLRAQKVRGRGPLVLLSSSRVVGRRLDTLRVV